MSTGHALRPAVGFTLIELMVTVAVVAILLVIAVPSFNGLIDKYRLKGAADALHAEMQFARTEAIRLNQAVYVSFGTQPTSCWGIGTTSGCACDSCEIRPRSASAFAADFPGIQIDSVTVGTDAATGFGFSPRQGATDAAGEVAVTLSSTQTSRALRVVVGLLGLPRTCSPNGAVTGYPAC